MSKVRLYGDTSGYVDLKAPDVASNVTITLPNTTGPFATETYVDGAVAAIPGIGSNVVSTTKANVFSTTSTTYTTVTGLTATITPTSSASKILVVAVVNAAVSSGNDALFQLLRDSTVIASGTSGTFANSFAMINSTTKDMMVSLVVSHLDSPATTSAITYSVEGRTAAGGTLWVNRRDVNDSYGGTSHLTVIEVAA